MVPLASRIRPNSLGDFIGQLHLLGDEGPITRMLQAGKITSMIFWGPPASGKTTLAQIIAKAVQAEFVTLSAVTDGKSELKQIVQVAKLNQAENKDTILFIDEIHRWSKAQQDALLPYVEDGTLTLIGATTENPSFTVVSPLLSRSRVFVLHSHSVDEIAQGLQRGVNELKAKISKDNLRYLAELSNGDMRFALNTLELACRSGGKTISKNEVELAAQKFLRYDRNGEEHYNLISAVHKSLRSSNPSAGAYWIVRMLAAGEDPLYIARRLIRFASEDIGNANPNALLLSNVVYDTCAKIGMPECEVALVQLAEYLASSKKSNKAYVADKLINQDISKYGNLDVPMHLRNAPTKLMKNIGYGKGYEYDPDLETGKSQQQCLPDSLANRNYWK